MKQRTKSQKIHMRLFPALAGLVCVGILFETAMLVFFSPQPVKTTRNPPISRQTIIADADTIVTKCKTVSYRPDCYDKEIPKLMARISMLDAFSVTRTVQDKDASYVYCHVLGHKLGAIATDRDQMHWKDVAATCPSGMCSNGCIHGVFQEHFRESQTTDTLSDTQLAKIIPDIADICEARQSWHPTGLEQATCYHAMGHLMMYITNADIRKSLPICDQTANRKGGRDYRHLCYDGVFMQIYQPLEPEDFALIKGKEVDRAHHQSFCDGFAGQVRGSCISEGWPLYRAELFTSTGVFTLCNMEDPQEFSRCFDGIMYVVTPQLNFDVAKLSEFCKNLPVLQGECAAQAASRFIETDYRNITRSIALCNAMAVFDPGNACYQEMVVFATFNFHKGSAEFYALCNALPVAWKTKCLQES